MDTKNTGQFECPINDLTGDSDTEIVDNRGGHSGDTRQNADSDIEIVDNCGGHGGDTRQNADSDIEHLLSPKVIYGVGPAPARSDCSFGFDLFPPSATNVLEVGKTSRIPTPKISKKKKKLTNAERKQKLINKFNLTGREFSLKKWRRWKNKKTRQKT